jgi:hypothetical protein
MTAARSAGRRGNEVRPRLRAIRRSGKGSKASGANLTLGGPPDGAARSPGIDPKATFEPQPNCPLPFLQQSLREQREPVLMT